MLYLRFEMSIIKQIFNFVTARKQENAASADKSVIIAFENQMETLLAEDRYIAGRDLKEILNTYREFYEKIGILYQSSTLSYFCKKNKISKDRLSRFVQAYDDIMKLSESELIKKHNQEFVKRQAESERGYLDEILVDVDPVIKLDDEQRKVVLSDEDYTLVIAGAGAGKTTTIAAKVRYLVEKQGVRPDEILVISFTNKAVEELRDKINKSLSIDCPITTFHKTGYAILRRGEEGDKTIVEPGFLYNVVNNYLKGNILENPELVDHLILFFGSYFDAPYEGSGLKDFFRYIKKADFSTLRSNISEYTENIIDKRTGKNISIAYETLRSVQEVRIANFLYVNGIEYSYEKPYKYNIINSNKPYTPDFTIIQGDKVAYIEHFGITQDGRNSRYTEEQLKQYKLAVNHKVKLHQKHKTDLIYTFSNYNDGRDFLEHLKEDLIKHGFILNPRPSIEIFNKIVSTEENKYIAKLSKLICTFIQNFKTNGYTLDKFHQFRSRTSNERTKLFLTVCEQCFYEYAKKLKERNAIDFEDMINNSAQLLREEKLNGRRLDFRYIIVDEYQDISRQRFNLAKELSDLCNAKIMAVGDDWQSIYAYAGSDIRLFTKFCETFGYGLELRITKTYRNAQEVIDIAGGFIQKNTTQIRKALISPKRIKDPVIVQTYTENVDRSLYSGKGGKYYLIGETVDKIMREILEDNPKSSILLLGRYGFDGFNLTKSADFIYWERSGNVTSKSFSDIEMEFMTVHRAKGLGYDNVIIINAIDSVYGFPSQIKDDPVLKYVVNDDHAIEYAEERRLFYVALTRTKNRVYIITPQQRPSAFVRELLQDYPNVKLRGELDEVNDSDKMEKMCPICGYPLQLRYKKSYGLKLWICSNEPEICDFMTNNLNGGILQIMKCDQCRDGYLIVKEGKTEPLLGCTNYKPDKTGCNNYMTMGYYKKSLKSNI